MSALVSFIRLSRPLFLLGGALMYGLGVASGAPISIGVYLLGQLGVSAAQITAHYVNEYADFEADQFVVNRTLFSGGSGALGDSGLIRSVAIKSAFASSLITFGAAAAVAIISPIAALLLILALVVSWAYSMPPVRLLNSGWGELVTSLVVVVVVPVIGVSITGTTPSASLWSAMAVLLPVHVAMMLVFEIPDATTDRMAGKTVLAVRLGEPKTLALIGGLYVLSGIVMLTANPGDYAGFGIASLAIALAVGGVFLSLGFRRFEWATALAVLVLVSLGSLAIVGFVV